MEYWMIDDHGIFEYLSELQNFYFLNKQNTDKDLQIMQLDYLLIKKLNNPLDLVNRTIYEKYDALSTYANQSRDYNVFVMLELIREQLFKYQSISEEDREDKLLLNRLANIAAGELIDFSILREIRRIIFLCLKENIIFDNLEDLIVENDDFER